jgi:stage II sporulation protein AA (anti-sigma F factor antagonist)
MDLTAQRRGDTLLISLNGEIDEHSAARLRKDADTLADKRLPVDRAVFDLTGVSFMDSTAIGFLLGRYKKFSRYGVKTYVTNPSPTADKILTISGVYSLIPKL